MLFRVLIFSSISFAIMLLVDFIIGVKAEFVNAWTVIQRLLGQPPTAGNSFVYNNSGETGELLIVVLINLAVGIILALLSKRLIKTKSNN